MSEPEKLESVRRMWSSWLRGCVAAANEYSNGLKQVTLVLYGTVPRPRRYRFRRALDLVEVMERGLQKLMERRCISGLEYRRTYGAIMDLRDKLRRGEPPSFEELEAFLSPVHDFARIAEEKGIYREFELPPEARDVLALLSRLKKR
ncbi:MAG: hypothetical protein ABWK00_03415 [Desulfurococcaceae archaeon]